MIDDEVTVIIVSLTHDLLLQGKKGSLAKETGRYLDDISFPIFKYGDLSITYKEYSLISKASKI